MKNADEIVGARRHPDRRTRFGAEDAGHRLRERRPRPAAGRQRARHAARGRAELDPRRRRSRPARTSKKPFPLNGYLPADVPKDYKPLPARHLQQPGLLCRQGALERPALFPLQQPAGDGVSARRSAAARREHVGLGCRRSVGPLRDRHAARGHREPVRLQDGAESTTRR